MTFLSLSRVQPAKSLEISVDCFCSIRSLRLVSLQVSQCRLIGCLSLASQSHLHRHFLFVGSFVSFTDGF